MKKEQLIKYTQKKDLSTKAKQEILDLIKKEPATNIAEIKELTDILIKLNTDVMYQFVVECLPKLSPDLVIEFIKSIKTVQTNKSKYLLVISAALSNVKAINEAQDFLEYYICSYATGSKINKQCFIDFERICIYQGSEIFFGKFDKSDKSINSYRRFLGELLRYTKNTDCKSNIKKWFEINNKPLSQEELELLTSNEMGTSTDIKESLAESTEEKVSDKQCDLNNADLPSILKILSDKIKESCSQSVAKDKKIADLTEELKISKLAVSQAKAEIETCTKTLAKKESELVEKESTITSLKKELSDQEKTIEELTSNVNVLTSKLSNVESAFGQAGKNEVDELRNKIRSRLASDHEKYLEIKSKDPDIDYYEILLIMLDEIYKVLKKNGIDF